MYGETRGVEECIAKEAGHALRNASAKSAKVDGGRELSTTVIIRADRTTPYHLIHQVIQACQAHGYRNFQYRALNRGV